MNAAYASLRRKARGRRGPSRAASPGVGDARPLPRRGEGRPQRRRQIRQKPWAGGLTAPVAQGGRGNLEKAAKPVPWQPDARKQRKGALDAIGRRAAKPWQRLRGLRRPLGRHKKRPQSKPCGRVANSRGESGSFILLRTKSFAHPYPPLP